jgi:hypothetical protein
MAVCVCGVMYVVELGKAAKREKNYMHFLYNAIFF